jgi:hypothetical protein
MVRLDQNPHGITLITNPSLLNIMSALFFIHFAKRLRIEAFLWNCWMLLRSQRLLQSASRVALVCAAVLLTRMAEAQTLYLLTTDNRLATVSATNPAANSAPLTITGVLSGDTLVAIDVRPQNQQLYALGVNATMNTATLYHLAPETGVATAMGSTFSFVQLDGTTPVIFPNPAGATWDVDFNPTVDRLRVVTSTGLNFRVNPNTGAPVDNDNNGANGINPDGSINGGTVSVHGTAYTNNQPNSTVTTQYTIDAASNSLYIQNPPNNGTQTLGVAITLSGMSLDFTDVRGFDIVPGVNTSISNAPVPSGSALFFATVAGGTSLYSLNLVNGQATLLGAPALDVRSAAIRTEVGAAFAVSGGTSLFRFNPATPGSGVTITLTGVVAGETLVGIDGRPQTGQLYGLGVNPATNTASLYLIDPQTGAMSPVGSPGQIAFVDAAGIAVPLPAASAGCGIDFNPTVDRIRVVTGTGLNFRVNPSTGAPVDGNVGAAGINPDGMLNFGGPIYGITAAAYTNSFGQSLAGGVTTLYSFDSGTGTLYIQNPPNNGTLTMPVSVSMNLGTATGFDIPADVVVGANSAVAVGRGWLVATQSGVSTLFQINLTTGALQSRGTFATGPISGLAVWRADAPIALTDDSVTVTTGTARINPLANDSLQATANIVFVSDPAIIIDGRTLIIPEGFTGSFFYEVSGGTTVGRGNVTVVAGTPAIEPQTFAGLLFNADGEIVGWASTKISASGVASVQLRGGAQAVRTRVTFPPDVNVAGRITGFGNLTLVRNSNGTVNVSLASLGGYISGTLRAAQGEATSAKHHIALASIDAGIPGGGFAIVNVSRRGTVRIRGTLPDGLPFSAATILCDNGSFAFFTVVAKGARPPGVLGGELITAGLLATDVTGELSYAKPKQTRSRGLHLDGLETILAANGSLYSGQDALLEGAGTLQLIGGDLASDESHSVTIAAGVPTVPTGALKAWTGVTQRTGTFTTKITVPSIARPVTGRGVYLPKSDRAWGWFPGNTVGGRIELTVP